MSSTLPVPGKDGVLFLPLGGCGQFGANFTLYGYNGSWIAVDCGMAFADERLPGVEIVLPDPTLIANQKERLKALFITHAHEDHIGAIEWLWPQLKCPIYATPFAASVIRRKCDEHAYTGGKPVITIVEPGDKIVLGDWTVNYIPVAHSIPESNALTIDTPLGRIMHTGDWCIDPTPVLKQKTDPEAFRAAGAPGILAYIGDSTNAEVMGKGTSEKDVEEGLTAVFKTAPRKIGVTIFSSNIARIISIHRAARACGRQVALVGRSLENMVDAARATGHIDNGMRFLSADDASEISDHKVVLIVTGSQGEQRAALARIARGVHPSVRMKPDDVMIFSSRAIPGNELEINEIKNALLVLGVKIITDRDACVHVSGHPERQDVAQMIDWLRPKIAIPVHGERAQMEAHASLAREKQIPHVHIPVNGEMLRLSKDGVRVEGHYTLHFRAIDFDRVVPVDHLPILERRKMSFNGAVFITLVADRDKGDVLDVQVSAIGLLDPEIKEEMSILTDLEDAVAERFEHLSRAERVSEHAGIEPVRACAKRFFRDLHDIKPLVNVHISLV